MRAHAVVTIGLVLLFGAYLCPNAYPQQGSTPREITSDDFGRPQSSSSPSASPTTPRPETRTHRKTTYKLARVEPRVFRRKPAPNPPIKPGPKNPMKVEEVGITLWRLRPPRPSDTGPKIPVQISSDRHEEWTPERVSANSQFRAGDRVRLAVESQRRGHLYVLNAEMYANGNLGKFLLLFPAPANRDGYGRLTAKQDNHVEPGLLVDIPDQAENVPYFKIEPKGSDYIGELILVIISPTPLVGLKLSNNQEIENMSLLTQWESTWGTDVNLYVKQEPDGDGFTDAEQKATCGAKARQLVLEKSNTQKADLMPCGPQTRRLTRDDPLPQSVYRVSVPKAHPIIVPVRLVVRRHEM